MCLYISISPDPRQIDGELRTTRIRLNRRLCATKTDKLYGGRGGIFLVNPPEQVSRLCLIGSCRNSGVKVRRSASKLTVGGRVNG